MRMKGKSQRPQLQLVLFQTCSKKLKFGNGLELDSVNKSFTGYKNH